MKNWVNCPICGESDTRREAEDEGFLLYCTNLSCASNGGDNFQAIKKRLTKEIGRDLIDKIIDEICK